MTGVAWLGLGAMGLPMARSVVASGHVVRGFDPATDRLETARSAGVKTRPSPREAASGAEFCVVMVATPDQMRDALFGPEGAAAALESGSIVVLMSTVGPSEASTCARRLSHEGIGMIDAPVSGGVVRAAEGRLLVMASGPPDLVDRAGPLLECVGEPVVTVGTSPCTAQAYKLVNQLLAGVHIAVAAEALAFAEALGLDPQGVWKVLRHGAAASFMLEDRGKRMLEADFDPPKSALNIFLKDMGLVLDEARRVAFPAALARSAEAMYLDGHRRGVGRLDDSIVFELLRSPAPVPRTAAVPELGRQDN